MSSSIASEMQEGIDSKKKVLDEDKNFKAHVTSHIKKQTIP